MTQTQRHQEEGRKCHQNRSEHLLSEQLSFAQVQILRWMNRGMKGLGLSSLFFPYGEAIK
jgi:hypothetical protein